MAADDKRRPNGMVSRRDFLRLASVGGGAALIAACGNTTTSGTTATTAPATDGAATTAPAGETAAVATAPPPPTEVVVGEGQTKITWWNVYYSDEVKAVVPKMMTEFEQQYPNVKVEYELTGGAPGGGNYNEVLLARIASGSPPDVASVLNTPAEYAARGSLTELDQYMSSAQYAKPDAYYPGPIGSCQWQGKTYGLPSSAGPGAIFYNTDKFDAKGIPTARDQFPKTWDELKTLSAEFVVREGNLINEVGLVPFAQTWFYPVWAANNGGQLYDAENNTYALVTEQNEEWLTNWLGWLDDQLGGSYEQLNISGGWVGAWPDQGFGQQKAAMCTDGAWVSTDAGMPFNWEVAKLPTGPQGTTSQTCFYPNWWIVPTGSPHPQEAFNFIEYTTTRGWQIWYTRILDTPAWREFPRDIANQKLVEIVGQERANELNGFFADYLNDSIAMWNSPIESFANETFVGMVEGVLTKTKQPRQALEEAQGILQARLEETLQGT